MLEVALILQLIFFLAVALVFLRSRQASIFHPCTVYLAFHGVVFVIRPFFAHYLHFDHSWQYMDFWPRDEDWLKTLMVTSLALGVFVTACLSASRGLPGQAGPAGAVPTPQLRTAFLLTATLLAPLLAYSIYATRHGVQGERVGAVFVMTGSSGYANDAQHMAVPLLAIFVWAFAFRRWTLVPVAMYLAYRAWVGWERWTIIICVFVLFLVYCWQRGRKWLPVHFLAVLLPLFVVFNWLGDRRGAFRGLLEGRGPPPKVLSGNGSTAEGIRTKLDKHDFANFDFLTYILAAVPERTGTYNYGLQYLQLFTEPIPRKLWKGKPAGAPFGRVNLNAYGNFYGLTPSLLGDGWVSGGWIGLVVTVGAAGWVLGRAHRWFRRHQANAFVAFSYCAIVAATIQLYRDGGISIFKFLLWLLLPILIWRVVYRAMNAQASPVSPIPAAGAWYLLPPHCQLALSGATRSSRGRPRLSWRRIHRRWPPPARWRRMKAAAPPHL